MIEKHMLNEIAFALSYVGIDENNKETFGCTILELQLICEQCDYLRMESWTTFAANKTRKNEVAVIRSEMAHAEAVNNWFTLEIETIMEWRRQWMWQLQPDKTRIQVAKFQQEYGCSPWNKSHGK